MQTFLPYPDIIKSVQCLDNKRLGKQRVEAMQILKALTNSSYGWQNHPAVKMWRDCEDVLQEYMNQCIQEWIRRGFNNHMLYCIYRENDFNEFWFPIRYLPEGKIFYPKWFGNEEFHDSHKSNLLRKDYDYYKQFDLWLS